MVQAHKIELKPRPRHIVELHKACGVARFTWNWALAAWNEEYAVPGNTPNSGMLLKRWNSEKPAWVYESPKDANQRPFTQLFRAWNQFLHGHTKKPIFKKRGNSRESFYVSNDRLTLSKSAARLPKIGWIRLTESLRFAGKILGATVSERAGRWFISVQVDTIPESIAIKQESTVGIDLGLTHTLTLSTGEKLEGPKPLRHHLKKLQRLSRQHARKQKGSNRRRKSAIKLARLHYRIANIWNDFLHKVTTRLCRENQTIVIEDLNVRGMMRLRLARALSDVGFCEFRRQLTYKAKLFGRELIIADRWFPSTKLCFACGTKNDLTLNDRTYKCNCGYEEDRDVNAARNLRTLGLRGTYARGQEGSGVVRGNTNDVKPAWLKREPNVTTTVTFRT